jgi:hypothetical protein
LRIREGRVQLSQTQVEESSMKALSIIVGVAGLAFLFAASATMAYVKEPVNDRWEQDQRTPYGYSAAWKSGADQPIVNVAAASPAKPRFRSYGEATSASGTWFPDHKPLAYGKSMDRSKIMAFEH